MARDSLNAPRMTLGQKAWQIHWTFVVLICCIAAIGVTMLYSAGNGSFDPWASRHIMRFAAGLGTLVAMALIDIRVWLRHAYVLYLLTLALLVVVEVAGSAGMGARRWIDLGFLTIQPSELMKITIVLALARYFHGSSIEDVVRLRHLIVPLFIVAAPAALVLRQPDLGTALMLVFVGAGLMFLAGVRIWKFVVVGLAGVASVPVAWQFLHDYQKRRVLTFFDPESDPLGAGYHIIQSKIALGSGGLFGKGLLQGTQSHLNFLPEMQTDFIFTMLAEEFGLTGGLVLLALYTLVLIYGIAISARCRSQFGRLVGMGATLTFFLYVFINIAMVMGLIPVVGVPLPLISYGGTAMLTVLVGFGLLMNVYVHRDVSIGRRGAAE
ncbi:MAG: rod shape-determining protein RodA [Rhodospirillales bacterium]|nr:rod shape-determining protein RodA [Rhodospirillales bacterium]MDP6774146.1 rod shape-determining protein RodA [Rhodospirillales bacterium]